MPKVIFLPNEEFCPEGMVVDAAAGDNLLEVAHNAGVEIHHACDGSCACSLEYGNRTSGGGRTQTI